MPAPKRANDNLWTPAAVATIHAVPVDVSMPMVPAFVGRYCQTHTPDLLYVNHYAG